MKIPRHTLVAKNITLEVRSLEESDAASFYTFLSEQRHPQSEIRTLVGGYESEKFTSVIRSALRSPSDFVLGAHVNDRLMAVCDCFDSTQEGDPMPLAEVGISVTPEFQNAGVGTTLLKFGLTRMTETRINEVMLSVLCENKSAIAVYKKLGFCVSREYVNRRNQHCFEMRRSCDQRQLSQDYRWDFDVSEKKEINELYGLCWPKYLLDPSDIRSDEHLANPPLRRPNDFFFFWGVRENLNGKLIAGMSAVSLYTEKDAETLSDDGWRFAQSACLLSEPPANTLCVLSAAIHPAHQGRDLSKNLIEHAKRLAQEKQFHSVILPVRPNRKHEFPELSLEDYLQVKNPHNETIDPWIRTHLKLGAETLNICHRSLIIKASISWWAEKAGINLYDSNPQLPQQALNPLRIDLSSNTAEYIEPNVWMRYRLADTKSAQWR